jgi:hypothetical protein
LSEHASKNTAMKLCDGLSCGSTTAIAGGLLKKKV